MLSSKCTHLRIRDNNDYDTNVDNLIKSIEKEFNIDFRSLPRWEELVQRLHVAATDCKRKIQDAQLRKAMIIDKLYIQYTRPSPFELTDGLCRTSGMKRKKKISSVEPELDEMSSQINSQDKMDETCDTVHPNTEIHSSESPDIEPEPSKVNVEVQVDSPRESTTHLPVVIVTNPHKYISPIGSQLCAISSKSLCTDDVIDAVTESGKDELLNLKPATSVVCTPTPIVLTDNTLKKQSIQFSVTNCGNEYLHIRFKKISDDSHFIKAKILPVIPKRLYPGIPVVFKFIFKLSSENEFKTNLYFKVGRDVYDEAPPEVFRVPITSAFTISRSVIISEVVTIPSVYPWHIKRNDMYSTATVNITVNDPYYYHLHIYKRLVDLSHGSDIILSLDASGPDSESVAQRVMDKQVSAKTIASSAKVTASSAKITASSAKVENTIESDLVKVIDSMAVISNDIVDLALDSFIFESTYLYLEPYSKVKIPVYFTKAEHIGYHQSYYDFELIDPETEKIKICKTVKIFAEILPHPIQIQPVILDMSQSPVSHGYCEDFFVVSNSHKLYPVTIKIKLTTKMKKMFYVEPMEAVVPTSSCVPFAVKFCSRDFLSPKPSEDLVHFTFKIIILGYKAVYENVPPLFYEVIAPCALEFKKVYNEKYFKEE